MNSDHQLWSQWTGQVWSGRTVPHAEILANARTWVHSFSKTGEIRIRRAFASTGATSVIIDARLEGPPAHDPAFRTAAAASFARWAKAGFGPTAWTRLSINVLAGDRQDGRPRTQAIIIPRIGSPP